MARVKSAQMSYVLAHTESGSSAPEALINKLGRWTLLSEDMLGCLRSLPGRTLTLDRGEIPEAGDADRHVVLVLEGWAAVYKDTPSGRRVILEFLLPGDFPLDHIRRQKSSGTMMLSPGKILLVPIGAWRAVAAHPPLQRGLAWIESVRESICREWLVNLASRKAFARLAHLLCELSVRSNSIGLLDGDACELPLTQMDLADALAMTNVHLNMALQRLRSAGVVEMSAKRLNIIDRPGLEAIAGFDDGYLLRWPTELPDRRLRPALPLPQKERRSRLLRRW